MRKLILLLMFFVPLLMQAQTDTTSKLKDAALQWAVFNNGGQEDTTVFAALSADYSAVLMVDSLNASANQGLGNLYSIRASIYTTLAQSIQSTNPSLSATYTTTSDYYSALAVPYMQRYLSIKGITH